MPAQLSLRKASYTAIVRFFAPHGNLKRGPNTRNFGDRQKMCRIRSASEGDEGGGGVSPRTNCRQRFTSLPKSLPVTNCNDSTAPTCMAGLAIDTSLPLTFKIRSPRRRPALSATLPVGSYTITANIEIPEEVDSVLAHGGEGIEEPPVALHRVRHQVLHPDPAAADCCDGKEVCGRRIVAFDGVAPGFVPVGVADREPLVPGPRDLCAECFHHADGDIEVRCRCRRCRDRDLDRVRWSRVCATRKSRHDFGPECSVLAPSGQIRQLDDAARPVRRALGLRAPDCPQLVTWA